MHSNPPGITTQVPKDFTLDPWLQGDIPSQGYVDLTVYDLMRHMRPINVVRSPGSWPFPPTLNGTPLRSYWHPWQRILRIRKYFPPGRYWVLRNLTTMEYVYAHVLTSEDGHGGGLDMPDAQHKWGFDLGTVVVVNTCWSDYPSEGRFGLNVCGQWAGNCFDIVDQARLFRDIKAGSEMWVDVSYREWAAMVELFKMNRWNNRSRGGITNDCENLTSCWH